jgi:hypothetical protein
MLKTFLGGLFSSSRKKHETSMYPKKDAEVRGGKTKG